MYVIGAGASAEAGLPTGNDLKNRISKILDFNSTRPDMLAYDALKLYIRQQQPNIHGPINTSDYVKAATHIRDALPLNISIDNLIDSHRGNDKIAICGKLAIVRSILQAEQESHLYSSNKTHLSVRNIENSWYLPFIQLLTENCTKQELPKRFETITLIIFNYDRVVEHFLYLALQLSYKISETEAAKLISHLRIYHPYGSVGSLPWQNKENPLPFGATPRINQLSSLINEIKTFTEGTDPNSSEIKAIQLYIQKAKKLVFLGFAFHKLNMQLITPATNKNWTTVTCYATTFGISNEDQEIIEQEIKKLYVGSDNKINVSLKALECKSFFDNFWKGLSF